MNTRGYMLRCRLAFALRDVKLHMGRRFVPVRLTEEQRYDIAEQVVRRLREYGDPWKLDEQVPEYKPAPAREMK